MKNNIFIFLIFVFSLLIYIPSSALAGNDLVINCDSKSCNNPSSLLFFDESNIAPGFSKSQIIRVINNRPDNCHLQISPKSISHPNPLSASQILSISSGNDILYAGNVDDFNSKINHQLGNIDNSQYKEYLFTFSLNQSVGNNSRLQKTLFNLDFNFNCDDDIDDDSYCKSSAPTQIPQNFKAVAGQNSVTLSWDEPSDYFTYYLISYSTHPHASTFASANIGGPGTSSYTIYNLSSGIRYYFKIRSGNACAPGQFSEIITAIPSGEILKNQSLPHGFRPTVLGSHNSIPTSSKITSEISCFKLIPFAFLLALIINFILIKSYFFLSVLISLSALIFDYYLSNYLCLKFQYFYINNLLSFLVPLLFSFKNRKT